MIIEKKFRAVVIPIIILLLIIAFEQVQNIFYQQKYQNLIFFTTSILLIVKFILFFMIVISIIRANFVVPFIQRFDKGRDYRWIIASMLLIYLLILIVSQTVFGDYKFLWRYLGVPAYRDGLFHDLKVITVSMECLRQGIDPLYNNSYSPGITFNYPDCWYIFQYTGVSGQHTKYIAFTIIALFYITCYCFLGRLSLVKSVLYCTIILSPPFMLAIERCNNDLVFFILLGISLFLLQLKSTNRYFAYIIILISTIFKVHPVFAFITAVKEKRQVITHVILPIALFLIIYVSLNLSSYLRSSEVTPRPYELFSFGSNVLGYHFCDNQLDSPGIKSLIMVISWGFALVLSGFLTMSSKKIEYTKPKESIEMDGFRLGSIMYLGAFLIGNNYDYRLIFILFCIPQILIWIKTRSTVRNQSILFLINLLLLLHFPSVIRHTITPSLIMISKGVIYWGFFAITYVLFLQSLPSNRFTRLLFHPSLSKSQ